MSEWVPTVAKAITAFVTVILAAAVAGQVQVDPWIEVVLTAALATIAVWAVPNAGSER